MIHLGEEGYVEITRRIMEASQAFEKGLMSIPELELVTKPDMCVVAWKSRVRSVNIYQLNDLMSKHGWQLNALQAPAALHFCFTAAHVGVVDLLLKVSIVNVLAERMCDKN